MTSCADAWPVTARAIRANVISAALFIDAPQAWSVILEVKMSCGHNRAFSILGASRALDVNKAFRAYDAARARRVAAHPQRECARRLSGSRRRAATQSQG